MFSIRQITRRLFIGDRVVKTPVDQLSPVLTEILRKSEPEPTLSPAAESRYKARYRTLGADVGLTSTRLKDSIKIVRFPIARPRLQELVEKNKYSGEMCMVGAMGLAAALEMSQHIRTQLYGRGVFLTQRGHLLPGPRDAQCGDTICVLLRGDVLFVLRPEREEFHLLGEWLCRWHHGWRSDGLC
jgi:hypothetical protein